MANSSSSAQQALQALGDRLREIRIDAGLTGRHLGALTGWHSSKISKIEHGKQVPSAADIHTWCDRCGASDHSEDLIASLHAAEGMFVEWRRMERGGLRHAQESVLGLWQRTRQFRIYSGWVVPGPVQTPDYIAAVLRAIVLRRELPDDTAEAVKVRVSKQRVLHQAGRTFAIVLEESVLRSRIGGAQTMAAQLGHLLVASALPAVSLGVIPLASDRSLTWAVEGFWMFDDDQVSVELVSGHLNITQPHEIAMYARTFKDLAELAVYGAPARQLITAAINALDT